MRDNLGDKKKRQQLIKEKDNKRKEEKCDNLYDYEKEQLKNTRKKGKAAVRDNLDHEQKIAVKKICENLCLPIFSQNGQLLIFRPKFGEIAQLRAIFWFKYC